MVKSRITLLLGISLFAVLPAHAQSGWKSLSHARDLVSPPTLFALDLRGEWDAPPPKEWPRITANAKRNQAALALVRRALRESFSGTPRVKRGERLARQWQILGFALVENGRAQLLRGDHEGAVNSFLDAVDFTQKVRGNARGEDTMTLFRVLNRLAGIGRNDIFYEAKHLTSSEWKRLLPRWERLEATRFVSPIGARVSDKAEIELARRGLELENVAVDTSIHLSLFRSNFNRSPKFPDELRQAGWKGLTADPFASGQHLRWKVITDKDGSARLLIYSAGPNGRFESGAPLHNSRKSKVLFDSPVLQLTHPDSSGDLEVLRFRQG